MGENDIKKHASRKQHQQLHNQIAQNQLLPTFIPTSWDSNAHEVMAAELAQIIMMYIMSITTHHSTMEWN
jgi:hypothetical protein